MSTSADSFDAPKRECMVLSIEKFSSNPFKYFDCEAGEYLLDNSLYLTLFGLSPYTLFVYVKIKTASLEYFLVFSSKFKVPKALTLKSSLGFVAAQSCDGCAAVCITISTLFF